MGLAAQVCLGEHYERLIEKLVESGRYSTSSEVVCDSLRLLEGRERLRESKLLELRAAIAEGDSSGPPVLLDMSAIKMEAKAAKRQSRS